MSSCTWGAVAFPDKSWGVLLCKAEALIKQVIMPSPLPPGLQAQIFGNGVHPETGLRAHGIFTPSTEKLLLPGSGSSDPVSVI